MVKGSATDDGRSRLASAQWLPALGPYRAFDQRWRILTTDPELASHLAELYAGARDPGAAPDGPGVTYQVLPVEDPGRRTPRARPGVLARDGEILATKGLPSTLLGRLVWTINRQVIDHSQDRLLLHAACAQLGEHCVLLPAAMEAGKTTLVTGLVDRGATYLTDEAAAVDEELTVEGYAKPLSIDRGAWTVLAHHEPRLSDPLRGYHRTQWQVPAPRVTRSGRLRLVVFPTYQPGAATRTQRLTPVEALKRAVPCTFAPEDATVPTAKVRRLAAVVAAVPCFSLVSGELDAACRAIIDLMAEPAVREAAARTAGPGPAASREHPPA